MNDAPFVSYTLVKHVHVACAVISISLFFLRGIWMLLDSPRLRARWVRILPHVNDTLLLVAAIWLALRSHQAPGTHDWLTAKVLGLIVYILLGMVALRWGRTKTIRAGAWLAALAVFGYIVAVALTRTPWGGLNR